MAGVFHRKGRLPALQDRLEAGEGVLRLGVPGGGCPPTDVEVVESDAGPGDGRGVMRAAEPLPRCIHRHNGALGVQDREMGGEGVECRPRPRLRRV